MTSDFPLGTVTFLLTDIEGSTRLWEAHSDAMQPALARHDALLRSIIERRGGHIVKNTGDGLLAVFGRATDCVAATLACQQALASEAWTGLAGPLRVRMGVHSGEAEFRDGDYYGSVLNRTARLMSIASGGQSLLSSATTELVRDGLPGEASLLDLGEHRLKDLTRPEHVFQLNMPGLPTEFPRLRSLSTLPNNLPVQLTTFIGRETEMAEAKRLLEATRLLTLTGPGGTGKTRLSLQVAADNMDDFPAGAWLVELAPLSDPAQIIPALAQVFGLQELPFNPLASQVIDYLRDKTILLLLDNCEHLIEACARLVDDLLHQCAGLKILASSREALGIAGEAAYRIPSLADSESVRLFVDRARLVNSSFRMTDANTSAIAQICRRLDGIPLALELAAARVKFLSPEQIAARLDDRFRLLIGGSRTALPRQQTLRALIDWSYDLLSDEEKHLLQFASVFVGGWTLDALEAVADDPDTLALLEQLINKSLVITEERGSEMRYFMLETIRQYAREKLFDVQQASAARDRHFVYFDELSEKLWEAFRSEDLLPMIHISRDEVENLRAALEWGFVNHIEENLRLAANFCGVSSLLGIHAEGLTIAKTAVEHARTLPPVNGDADIRRQKLIARVLFMQGLAGLGAGNIPFVLQTLREAIAISRVTGDKLILGYSLGLYSVASGFIPTPDREQAAQEGFTIFSQEMDDSFGLTMGYMNMARLASEKGNESEKEMYFGKVREIIREAPNSYQVGIFHLGMGRDESAHGNYQEAKKLLEDGIEINKGIGSVHFQLMLRSEIGHIERRTGNLTQARSIYQETIQGWQVLGHRPAIAHQLECFGFLAISDEEPQRAVKLFGAAEALRQRIQSPMVDHEQVEYDQSVKRLRSMLAEANFDALWAEGRSMTMEQAIQLALSDGG